MRRLVAQLTRFGLVGLVGLVIDVGVFNILRATVLSPEELHSGPLIAKIISTSLAITANWLGNRYWTFRTERRSALIREGIQFAIVSVGGMLIALGCLWVSHYLLGYTSVVADNISSNVVGLVLGTAFRFWLYRTWVFAHVGVANNEPADGDGPDGSGADDESPLSEDPLSEDPMRLSGRAPQPVQPDASPQ